MEKDGISIQEAARMIGVTNDFLRAAIVQQKIPGAVAVDRGKRFSFWINRIEFEKWLSSEQQKKEFLAWTADQNS
jgi:hypothetical protein